MKMEIEDNLPAIIMKVLWDSWCNWSWHFILHWTVDAMRIENSQLNLIIGNVPKPGIQMVRIQSDE